MPEHMVAELEQIQLETYEPFSLEDITHDELVAQMMEEEFERAVVAGLVRGLL